MCFGHFHTNFSRTDVIFKYSNYHNTLDVIKIYRYRLAVWRTVNVLNHFNLYIVPNFLMNKHKLDILHKYGQWIEDIGGEASYQK